MKTKLALLALCGLLAAAPAAEAQIVSAPGGMGGAFTTPVLGPSGCIAPPYSFTDAPTSGVCYNGGLFVKSTDLIQLTVDSGGFPGSLTVTEGDITAFFLSGAFDATMQMTTVGIGNYYVFLGSGGTSGTAQLGMHTLGIGIFETTDGTGTAQVNLDATVPNITLVANDGTNSTTVGFTAPSGTHTINFPAASGTVALAGGGATKVSQALDLVTSEVTSGAGAATDLLFAPSNSTRYRVTGTFLVASNTTAYGVGFRVVWPTSDALAGSCTFRGPSSTTAHTWTTVGTASTGSGLLADWPSVPDITAVATFLTYMDCVFSTTTNTSGNFALTFAGENAAGSYTLFAGSYFEWSVF